MKNMLSNPTLGRCAGVLCTIILLLAAGGVYAADEFTSITLTVPSGSVRIGNTVQLTAIGKKADGSQVDITQGSTGTKYSTPEDLVSITADGLVAINGAPFRTTHDNYLVWIIANNGSAAATIAIAVIPTDADADGMEDDFERRHGLNPANPADAALDSDNDGLTNLKEFQSGTDPNLRDTDGDGVSDSEEIRRGSNPLNPNSQFALNQNCLVSVLNRSALVKIGGSWSIPNVPTNMGQVRARVNCVDNGITISGQSDFFTVPTNGRIDVFGIHLATPEPVPQFLTVTSPAATLTSIGATAQLIVIANFANQTTRIVTPASSGTTYTTSNTAVVTVSSDGLVTARGSGTAVISALNDGAIGIIRIQAALSGDSDGDGIPDDVELSLGLDPHNPVDAQEDLDRDGLTNFREFQLGTGIRNSDSDADGLSDGDEADNRHTNPLLADTDGDLIPDGVEVQTGSNPLDLNSYNLAAATASSVVKPASFVLTTSVLFPVASQQLSWKVNLIDGKTTLDLTADPRTNYASSDLTVCNFGAQKGLVFAGNPGSCVITISNNTLSVTVSGTVQSFTPTALSFVDIPGFANNVDVSGSFAYVAAGSAGLQVVNVSDRLHPHVVASRSLPGNANDVGVAGNFAYVAAGSGGLQVVNIADPLAPVVAGSLNTSGVAWDVVIKGSRAYVANGAGGLVIIDVSTPSSPVQLGSLSLPGTSKGVDVDAIRQIAAVGLGANGLAVVNVANPAAPTLMSMLPGGDARDVAISGNFVFLADFSRSFTSVDLTNPASPVLRASTAPSLGGLLEDVAVNGSMAAGADVFFVNGVPMIDVSTPASPQPRIIINFSAFRDDNGTGIAMDQSYMYLTAEAGTLSENGVNGTTRLYIGQYRNIQDNLGVPPTVQITSPSSGTQVIQGSSVTVTASATDDVAVAAVSFSVNGQVAFTATTAPYQFSFTAPSTGSTVTLGATAVDFGSNVGQSPNVTLNLIPDPLTTVVGRVLDANSNPVQGATVTTNGQQATTNADGTFSIPGVPTILGNIIVAASATVNGVQLRGNSASVAPVPGGQTNVGDVIVRRGRLFGIVFNGPSGPSTLYSIDHLTGVATAIGPVGFNAVSAMDFDSSGTLYAVGRRPADSVSVLITINTTTGAGTVVGPTGVENLGFGDSVSDISFRNSDGALYAYLEAGDGVGTINKLTGAITALGSSGISCCGNGIAFSPGDVLFHTNEDNLHTLNQTTGQATLVAPMTFPVPVSDFPRINAMDYQPGTGVLFGSLLRGNGSARLSYLVTVDTSNGVVTMIGQTVTLLDAIAFQ